MSITSRNIPFIFLLFLFSCAQEKKKTETTETKPERVISVPSFNSDTAYAYVKTQVDFGPRVPGTKAHEACAEFMISELKKFADSVIVQQGTVTAFDKKKLEFKNIIAQFSPQQKRRILLCAHWDSRPWADQDTVRKGEPIDAACDAGSGVAVLLEIARHLKQSKPAVGIDIIMLDVEDYGQPDDSPFEKMQDSYALGTQYWAKNPHVPGYYAEYGILFDMVGAKNATFYQERYSLQYAASIVNKIWSAASQIGYSDYFPFPNDQRKLNEGGFVIDDHFYINTIANIPCVDIIQHDPSTRSGFGSYWHTHRDNMSIIDANTMKAVGQTVLQVIYSE